MKIKRPQKVHLNRETLRILEAGDFKQAFGMSTDPCNTVRPSICRSNCPC